MKLNEQLQICANVLELAFAASSVGLLRSKISNQNAGLQSCCADSAPGSAEWHDAQDLEKVANEANRTIRKVLNPNKLKMKFKNNFSASFSLAEYGRGSKRCFDQDRKIHNRRVA